jgi:hypothetical protein
MTDFVLNHVRSRVSFSRSMCPAHTIAVVAQRRSAAPSRRARRRTDDRQMRRARRIQQLEPEIRSATAPHGPLAAQHAATASRVHRCFKSGRLPALSLSLPLGPLTPCSRSFPDCVFRSTWALVPLTWAPVPENLGAPNRREATTGLFDALQVVAHRPFRQTRRCLNLSLRAASLELQPQYFSNPSHGVSARHRLGRPVQVQAPESIAAELRRVQIPFCIADADSPAWRRKHDHEWLERNGRSESRGGGIAV